MSVKERRARQKQATREGILASAREIARLDGWGAVTIRRIADSIEYTPPVIYQYFRSKDAILIAVQSIGFEELAAALIAAGKDARDQTERLIEMGRAYWRFAEQSPELYEIMHGWESAALPMEETLKGARISAGIVQDALEEWAAEKEIWLPDLEGTVEVLWALLLGFISVRKLDRVGGGPERAEHLAVQAVRDLLFAWTSRSK